jgi:hypothetical protein
METGSESRVSMASTASDLRMTPVLTANAAGVSQVAQTVSVSSSLLIPTIALAQLPALVVLLLVLVISGGGPPV